MPTYEYECNACGERFERVQSILDQPIRKCPRCEGRLRRLISSGGGIIVKGGNSRQARAGCSLADTGETCCGRSERCDAGSCRNDG